MKICFISLLLLSSSCFATGTPLNLEGKYLCYGNEVETREAFKCEMILKKTGETYSNIANCNDGNSYTGTAIYEQTVHRLSTAFINPKKAEETGIAVADFKEDGSTFIVWTYLNKTTTGHSKCIRQEK